MNLPAASPSKFENARVRHPSFSEALRFWFKLGFISFGGPTGQIAIMHAELVEKKRWIGEARFLHALNYCMLLPGPEAQQLAIYAGWLLHRTWGGIAAGVLFVLPSAFILMALSAVYVAYGQIPWMAAVFYGLKPTVMAIVAAAVIRIGRKALKNEVMWAIAAGAFASIFFFRVPFPVVIIAAAIVGWLGSLRYPAKFKNSGHESKTEITLLNDDDEAEPHTRPSALRAVRVLVTSLVLWWFPVVIAGLTQGWAGTLAREAVFFSKAAMITFGGAYAVLPYVAQQAVDHYAWLSGPQMLDGLAFAETTPGPLIMVLQHVGFMSGWNHPGSLAPWTSAILAALMATWVTFVPCFLWIFLGAPHIEQLRGKPRINAALSAVTASVVGVVLNLAVWFGWQVIFPRKEYIDLFALLLAVMSFVAIQRFKVDVMAVILVSGLAGLMWHFV